VWTLVQLDRARLGQFESVRQGELVGGVISFVEDERRFSRRPRGTSQLFEPTLKLLQHLRRLFCIVAVAFINVVKQWQVCIGRAEQRIADLPKIGPPLLVLAPFGQLALKIESVDEGVEVGAVITDL